MAKEIERKFLVCSDAYLNIAVKVIHIAQAYLSTDPDATIRVRLADNRAFLTVKTRNIGATRNEWEYEIPMTDATEMISSCKSGIIDKFRYIVFYEGCKWEIDRFVGAHEGLVLAEIELPSEDTAFSIPPFIGKEVTGDPQYYNSNLSKGKK